MIFYKDYVDDGSMFGWCHDFDDDDGDYIRGYVEENMPWWRSEHPDNTLEIPFYNPFLDDEVDVTITLGDWFNTDEFNSVS